ncbi:transcription antitermination factor NusB [Chloroflexota bacterium]
MTGARRRARITAFQAIFEIDSTGHAVEAVLNNLLAKGGLSDENTTFIRELVRGAIRNRDKIDPIIKKLAPAWPIEQIPVVDRNILRLAIFEILFDNKVPVRIIINEAVELAKTFGGDNSLKFVNGVLASVSAHANR